MQHSNDPSTPRATQAAVVHSVLALGAFAIGTTEFATMSLLPSFAAGLGVDAPTAGHAISAYALGVVVGAPLLVVGGARASRRSLLMALMLAFALGNAASALAPTFDALLVLRFLTGVPHGAYFGIAALVAAAQVAPQNRMGAVGRVMAGFALATIVGVPLANTLGHWLGWRWSFAAVAGIALLTAVLVQRFIPADRPNPEASPWLELGALRKTQVWLTLGIGAIGFGGMFAVYTYLTSTLASVTHAPVAAVPWVLAVFGIGMAIGNLVIPRFAGRAVLATAASLLLWSALALALYPLASTRLWSITLAVGALGVGGALGTVLQTRLMDVAGNAQALAAALNHSAFNTANALGPWLAGLAITAGYGFTSTGWVGAALAVGGLAICGVSALVGRQTVDPKAAR